MKANGDPEHGEAPTELRPEMPGQRSGSGADDRLRPSPRFLTADLAF